MLLSEKTTANIGIAASGLKCKIQHWFIVQNEIFSLLAKL